MRPLGKLTAVTVGDFAKTIKRSREKLGLSQARVGELVGRSASAVRAWEHGRSTPNDFQTITSLAAVLALDEYELSRAAGVEAPAPRSQLTLEQVLSEITPPRLEPVEKAPPLRPEPEPETVTPPPQPEPEPELGPETVAPPEQTTVPEPEPEPVPESPAAALPAHDDLPTRVHEKSNDRGRHTRSARTEVQPFPPPLSVLPEAPPGELSYVEDPGQKVLYRTRSVLTAAGVVAMAYLLVWSVREATAAVDVFWELLTGNL